LVGLLSPAALPQRKKEPTAFRALTREDFHVLASLLDVSRSNADDIFERIAASSRGPTPEQLEDVFEEPPSPGSPATREARQQAWRSSCAESTDSKEDVCYLNEFLEQLVLWLDNPLDRNMNTFARRRKSVNAVKLSVAPTKKALFAFKAELQPPSRPMVSFEKTGTDTPSKRHKPIPRMPWKGTWAPSLTQVVPFGVLPGG